jgi:hypothetical protein
MTRFLTTLFVLPLLVSVAFGQEPSRIRITTSTATADDGQRVEVTELQLSGMLERAALESILNPTPFPRAGTDAGFRLPDAAFTINAVYFDFGHGTALVPMTGGGASGCLTEDLANRARVLKAYSSTLPARVPR